jgi:hypothetical protein
MERQGKAWLWHGLGRSKNVLVNLLNSGINEARAGVVLEAASRVRCVLVLLKAKGVAYCSRETGGRAGLYFF